MWAGSRQSRDGNERKERGRTPKLAPRCLLLCPLLTAHHFLFKLYAEVEQFARQVNINSLGGNVHADDAVTDENEEALAAFQFFAVMKINMKGRWTNQVSSAHALRHSHGQSFAPQIECRARPFG